jgi:hypothetical protein
MKLFCREDHSEPVIEQRNLSVELTEARAHLARLKRLPLSAFAEKSHKVMRYSPFGPFSYSVDNKDDAIARAEAEIAELEILASPNNSDKRKGTK